MEDRWEDKQFALEKKVTRRAFMKIMGGLGLAGITTSLAGCGTTSVTGRAGGEGWLPAQYQGNGAWPAQVRGRVPLDDNNVSIVRDDEKCILCGQCLEVCKNTQTVFGHYGFPLLDEIVCINCGQCALWCPTAAITERDDTETVWQALQDPDKHVVVQTAPATRVSLGEEFGLPPGTWVMGQQVAALKRLGFDAVFDTNFTADLTIMEEATELIKRIKGDIKLPLPQFTSCSPGWVKFCEYFYPDLFPHLSTCKSPQQMLGALVKTYYAREKNIKPEKIFTVSIMPCTAKKFEAGRPEMNDSGHYWHKPALRDVDAVLTTRELARLLKKQGIDLNTLPEENYDPLLGQSTGGAVIFGATGGVMEAAVRTAYYFITRKQPPAGLLSLQPVRGLAGVKEAALDVSGVGTVRVAVCHGMSNGRQVLESVRKGDAPWHFVEFMSCPGGCISGGGQPRSAVPPSDEVRNKRMAGLYKADARMVWRESHENPEVLALYQNFLQHPMSELAEELLHTSYTDRSKNYNHLAAEKLTRVG